MNKEIWFVVLALIVGGLILFFRHKEVKFEIKLSFQKMCVLGVLVLLCFVGYAYRLKIKEYWLHRKSKILSEKIDSNQQKHKVNPFLDKLEELEKLSQERPLTDGELREKKNAEWKLIKIYKEKSQPNKLQAIKRQKIIKEFWIPISMIRDKNKRNVDNNIKTTGLFPNRGSVRIEIIEGGPAQYRKGITNHRSDRYQIFNDLTINNTVQGGEVQFIMWDKPTKVRVEIIPAN